MVPINVKIIKYIPMKHLFIYVKALVINVQGTFRLFPNKYVCNPSFFLLYYLKHKPNLKGYVPVQNYENSNHDNSNIEVFFT